MSLIFDYFYNKDKGIVCIIIIVDRLVALFNNDCRRRRAESVEANLKIIQQERATAEYKWEEENIKKTTTTKQLKRHLLLLK